MQLDDHKQIRALYETTARALRAGDIQTLAACYTDDAIQFPPDSAPLIGWAAISKSLVNELRGMEFDSTLDVMEVEVQGGSAYAWGHFRAVIIPASGGARSVTSGSFLDILRRQSDGSWRIARSTWSNHEPDG